MFFFIRSLHVSFFILFIQIGGGKLAAQQINETDRLQLEMSLRKLNSPKQTNQKKIESLFQIGVLYNKNGNTDSARFYLREALKIPGGEKYQGGRIMVNIANSYVLDGKYSEALKYYQEALDIAERSKKIGERSNIIRAMANLSECYYSIGNCSQALYYAEQALEKYPEIGDLSLCYILPQIYYTMGVVHLERDELELAEENMLHTFEVADSLYQFQKNEGGIVIYKSYGMEGLARVHLNRKAYAKAIECAENAFTYAEEDGDVSVLAKVLATLSDIYLELQQYDDAKKYALKAVETNPSTIELNPNIAYNMAVAELFAGNKEQSYHYFQVHSNQMKLNTDKNFRETMASMEVEYKTAKKEIRIAALEKDQKLYMGLGASIVTTLLLGMVLLYYRHHLKQKLTEQQIRQLEQEKELITARSALAAEKVEREIIARDLHDGVGAMLSVVKNNMNIMKSDSTIENKESDYFNKALDVLDKSIVELRRVAHHIMPAILVEKGLSVALDDFCRSIPEAEFYCSELERRFDPEKELVLYRCTYELVNNALRHSKGSRIEIHLNMDKDTAYLSVVDDGSGFDIQTVSQGMGMKNMCARLVAFGGIIDIYSEPGIGTEANVELKI